MNDHPAKLRVAVAVVGLTALAPAMGGSVDLWAQSVLALGAGLLLVIAPPRRSLGPVPNALFAALFLVALSAFLPASWFPTPDWKSHLLALGAELPSTRSPQPWLTLQWTGFLLLTLAWGYYLAVFQWRRRLRVTACVAFGLAVLVLAAVLTAGFVTKWRVPFWPAVDEFGFFPNRNQTSNVLGLGGVMIYALGLQRFQEHRKYWWIWFASLSLICWALIIDGSRAGIILFFFGALTLHIYWWSTTKDHYEPLVAFGGLALLIALFVVDGGATLMRFGRETAGFFEADRNLRISIHRDAMNLIFHSSPLGIGLGNFWPIFAVHRRYSAIYSQIAHPESDWLWGTIDLGWFGTLIAVGLFVWWISQCRPFSAGTARLLPVGAMICGIAFMLHGFFDVSGHRLGALWPALFFGSVAIHPDQPYQRSRFVGPIFRLVGLVLVGIGCWWLGAREPNMPPTTARIDELVIKSDAAIESQNYDRAIATLTEGLTIAPLDGMFYFRRGVAEAGSFETRDKIKRDFDIVKYLMPNWPELYLKQGSVWLSIGEPDLAFDVWSEAMERFSNMAPAFYADLFGFVRSDVALRERWRKLGEGDPRLQLIFLRSADQMDFEIELQQLLDEDPQLRSLGPAELKVLFGLWYQKGDKLRLAETLRQHPEWRSIAWRQLAAVYADFQDYRQAVETATAFMQASDNAAATHPPESLEELNLRFRRNLSDGDAGLALAELQMREGKIDDALSTAQALSALENPPKDLPLMKANLWAKKGDWRRAWNAIAPAVSTE